ncbi:MAG: hypothetical protein HY716_16810 [Planctomycetes bacterium]|nr:hypothetical protein [Planctomycetota bacterium]
MMKTLTRHRKRHEQQSEEPTLKPKYATMGPSIDIMPDVSTYSLIPIYDPKAEQKLMEELDKICERLIGSLKKLAK